MPIAPRAPLALTADSPLSRALELGPGVLEYVIGLNPRDFRRLRNPLMRRLMPGRIRLGRLARMVGLPVTGLIRGIQVASGLPLEDFPPLEDAEREEAKTRALPDNPSRRPDWSREPVQSVVDLLAADDRLDTDPARPVHLAIKRASPGDVVLIRHRWEPQPLFDVWTKMGWEFYSTRRSADEVWIYVRKPPLEGRESLPSGADPETGERS